MTYLIIGGGLSGLLAARTLKSKNLEFQGIEQAEFLGGRATVGHHRIYQKESTSLLKDSIKDCPDWVEIKEPPLMWQKNEWVPVQATDYPNYESFYLGSSFYVPGEKGFSKIIESLIDEVGQKFSMSAKVKRIDLSTNELELETGDFISFECLVWCAPTEELARLCPEISSQFGAPKKKKISSVPGGINLDMELRTPVLEQRNTVVFPFRFKDKKLKALGITQDREPCTAHWVMFLEDETMEDREEVAKCVRALKRELRKAFPQYLEAIIKERIGYFPKLSGETSVTVEDLSIHPNIICLGPEVHLKGDHQEPMANMDLSLENLRVFQNLVSPEPITIGASI